MTDDMREAVRQRYAAAARTASCCGEASCCGGKKEPISADLYSLEEIAELPAEALLASLGCGNPVALAEISEGEVVLDLGSGGGVDVLLSARRTGPSGKAYGLDMTDEMLDLARRNARKAGVQNVEFLKGHIEAIPLPDSSVDVIISNCVINLSADKERVFAEAFRVLRPGGRLAVADIVARHELPASVAARLDLWTACVAGAPLDRDYVRMLEGAGFRNVSLQSIREYTPEDARALLATPDCVPDEEVAVAVASSIYSAFVRAEKPAL
ncbi:MAG: arsenite methyltransferase [Armatimonadota bacterium]